MSLTDLEDQHQEWARPTAAAALASPATGLAVRLRKDLTKDGLGLDDKSRYDLFVSQTHVALFVDGRLVGQSDIPAGTFPWSSQPLKAYCSHYIYHSDIEWSAELTSYTEHGQNYCYPLNSIFINDPLNGFPASSLCNALPPGYGYRYSDERHWDNMGFEVLPAGSASATAFDVRIAACNPILDSLRNFQVRPAPRQVFASSGCCSTRFAQNSSCRRFTGNRTASDIHQ